MFILTLHQWLTGVFGFKWQSFCRWFPAIHDYTATGWHRNSSERLKEIRTLIWEKKWLMAYGLWLMACVGFFWFSAAFRNNNQVSLDPCKFCWVQFLRFLWGTNLRAWKCSTIGLNLCPRNASSPTDSWATITTWKSLPVKTVACFSVLFSCKAHNRSHHYRHFVE